MRRRPGLTDLREIVCFFPKLKLDSRKKTGQFSLAAVKAALGFEVPSAQTQAILSFASPSSTA